MNFLRMLAPAVATALMIAVPQWVLAEWVDVTSSVEITKTQRAFDRVNRVIFSYATLKNTSGQNLNGQMELRIIDPSVAVINADGITAEGDAYIYIGDVLSPGEERVVRIDFALTRRAIEYELSLVKEGFVLETSNGDNYNPPAAERYVSEPSPDYEGVFAPYVDGSFIVWFVDGTPREQVVTIASTFGATIQGEFAGSNQYLLGVSQPGLDYAQMEVIREQLEAAPEVKFASINSLISSESVGFSSDGESAESSQYLSGVSEPGLNDTQIGVIPGQFEPAPELQFPSTNTSSSSAVAEFSSGAANSTDQYYLEAAGIRAAWRFLEQGGLSIGGTEKTIGVIDTILGHHVDLEPQDISGCFDEGNCVSEIKSRQDGVLSLSPLYNDTDEGSIESGKGVALTCDRSDGTDGSLTSTVSHGTHVTGIIGATHDSAGVDGVMRDKKILFRRIGVTGFYSLYDVYYSQVLLVKSFGASIVNMSLGDSSPPIKVIFRDEELSIDGLVLTRDIHEDLIYFYVVNSNGRVHIEKKGFSFASDGDSFWNECDIRTTSGLYRTAGAFFESEIDTEFWGFLGIGYSENTPNHVELTAELVKAKFFRNSEIEQEFYRDTLGLEERDVLIIQSAGNDNADALSNGLACALPLNDPMRHKTICVGALAEEPGSDGLQLAELSNYGVAVDVATYGENIRSTVLFKPDTTVGSDNAYDNWAGTSMAAPIITGIAGLIWNAYPDLTAEEVKEAIVESATEVTVAREDGMAGAGIPVANAEEALKWAEFYATLVRTGGRDEMRIAGMNDGSFVIDDRGSLWTFGEDTGAYYDYEEPYPKSVDIPEKVVSVDASEVLVAALDETGHVWQWSSRPFGFGSNYPERLDGLSGIKKIKHGGNSFFAIKEDGTLWEFGLREIVQVAGVDNVIETAGSYENLVVLREDGSVWQFPPSLAGNP